MKIAKKSAPSADEFRSTASGEITKENYGARAAAFIRGCGGVGFVIRAFEGAKGSVATSLPATEPQWAAWINYFYSKEITHAFVLAHGLATVPCEWPEMFDYEAPVSDRNARLRPPPEPISAERRAEVSQRFDELCASVRVRDKRHKIFNVHDLSPAMAKAHLEKITADNLAAAKLAVSPLRLTDASLSRIGLSPLPKEGERA